MERLLSMKEAKELLGVQTIAIQEWDRQGIIRTVGGRRRIPESEILRLQGLGKDDKRRIIGYARVVLNNDVSKIIVSYPDRLTRFGYETLKEIFSHFGTEIDTINEPVYHTGRDGRDGRRFDYNYYTFFWNVIWNEVS